jgi:TldD protein
MQKTKRIFYILAILIITKTSVSGQDTLMLLLDNVFKGLEKEYSMKEQPPYFIDMRVHEIKSHLLRYSFGILTNQSQSYHRLATIRMRIGSYEKDNTTSDGSKETMNLRNSVYTDKLPLENDSLSIYKALERNFEITYKFTLQQYKALLKKDNPQENKDVIPAFSREQASVYYEPPAEPQLDEKSFNAWKNILKNIATDISSDNEIVNSEIAMLVMEERIYYLNSEGSRITQNRPQCQIQLMFVVKTRNGNVAPFVKSYIGQTMSALPSAENLNKKIQQIRQILNELKDAPPADPYAGPAILSPEAAGVFFHEIFGHRIEGQRLNNAYDNQTFKDKIGKKIINEDISIISDPTITEFNGIPLFGSYKYDDEGIAARPVIIIENGILKNYLMSRSPIKGQMQSNGHGRAQVGSAPFSRQSNLIIKTKNSTNEAAMRKILIKECKKQGKAYGYYIKEVYGGFTTTDLFSSQVFNIIPTIVYRVYVDGRPDELVRGVNFIGTPLTVFSEIIASGDKYEVFNGFCGAESGNIPVSTVSPSFLIKKIETQRIPETKAVIPSLQSPIEEK